MERPAKRQKTPLPLPPAAAAHLYVHGTVKLGADGHSRWRVDGSTKKAPFVWEPVAVTAETSPGHAQAARAAARAARTAALEATAGHDDPAPPPQPPAAEPACAPHMPPVSSTRERRQSRVTATPSDAKPPPRKPSPGSLAGVAASAAPVAAPAAAAVAVAAMAAGDSDGTASPDSPEPLAADEYLVKELLDRKVLRAKGGRSQVLFLVAWKGYRKDQATWLTLTLTLTLILALALTLTLTPTLTLTRPPRSSELGLG